MKSTENLSRQQLEDLLFSLRDYTRSLQKELSDTKEQLDLAKAGNISNDTDSQLPRAQFFKAAAKKIAVVMLVTAAAVALITTYVFPVMRIYGSSMSATLVDGDIVIMHKTAKLDHGDICGFYYGGRVLCKRVIGLPGDVIDIAPDGTVSVNGTVIDEPYIKYKSLGDGDVLFPCTVPENSYFVLGDNRRASVDSRNSVIGFVTEDQVAGDIFFCLLPLPGFGTVD